MGRMQKEDKTKLGRILLKQKLTNPEELDQLLNEQSQDNQRLASKALEKGMVPETELLKALSEQHGIPAINIEKIEISLVNLDFIPRDIAQTHLILPIAVTDEAINLVMANPDDQRVIEEIEFVSGKRVFPHVALQIQLMNAIDRAYNAREAGEPFYRGPRFTQAAGDRKGLMSEVPRGQGAIIADEQNDFDLEIEVDVPEESEVVRALSQPPPARVIPAPSDAKTILVVDDEDDIRLLFERVLSDKGYEVLTASRGLEAIQKVQSTVPDLIILDAMLPEVHGFDICKRIKYSSKYGHIPVIMISAIYRGWRYAEDLKSSYGVDEFLEKPFKINDLTKKVAALLAVSSQKETIPPDDISKASEETVEACIRAYRAGDIDGAITLLKQGLQIDPLAHQLHYHLALLLGKKELNYQAIRSLENALDLQPGYFPALKNLAVLYQKTGFKFKAVETWEKALNYCEEETMREKIKDHLMKLL